MAKYGLFVYANTNLSGTLYGELVNVGSFYNANLTALSYDYGSVRVNWTSITADPSNRVLTHWKLIKSYGGQSDSPYEGLVLDGDTFDNFRLNYFDIDDSYGKQVTYSMWVFDGLTWTLCGSATETLVGDSGTLGKLEKWIPASWLNSSSITNNLSGYVKTENFGDASGEPDAGDFNTMLSAFSFEYDRLRALANMLELSTDSAYIPTQLLKYKVTDLGFDYEPSLGDLYHRALYKSGIRTLSAKGTEPATKSFITGLTHWSNTIDSGNNLFLDYNDSSFEESVGRWNAVNATLSQRFYAATTTELGVTIAAPTPNVYDTNSPPRTSGYMLVTSGTAVTKVVTLSLPGTPILSSAAINYGIPVSQLNYYLFTGWIRHLDHAATVKTSINWYDLLGNALGSAVVGSTTTTTTASWQEFTSGTSNRYGVQAPYGAVYASIGLTITVNTAGDRFLIDMLQFSTGGLNTLEYQDPRKVIVNIDGDTSNLLPNPSFDSGTGSWFALNGSLEQDYTAPTSALRPNEILVVSASAALGVTTLVLNTQVSGVAPVNVKDIVQGMYVYGAGIAPGTKVVSFNYSTLAVQISSATTAQVVGTVSFVSYFGGSVAKVVALTTGDVAIISDWVAVDPARSYYFSVDVSSPNDAVCQATARLEFSAPQVDSAQTLLSYDSNNQPYYSNNNSYTDSDPLDLTSYYQEISVTGLAPDQTVDSPRPLAKVSVYIYDAQVGDIFYINNASLTHYMNTDMAMMWNPNFFTGSGSPMNGIGLYNYSSDDLKSHALNDEYFSSSESQWEVKTRYNFLNNPSFELVTLPNGSILTDWVAGTGTTLTQSTTGLTGDNIYLFGSTVVSLINYPGHSAKVVNASGGTMGVQVFPPHAAYPTGSNSEDMVVSAYVYGPAGTYTISTNSTGISGTLSNVQSQSFVIESSNANQWIRIWATRIPNQGETSFWLLISSTASTFYVDGAQAEYGRIVTKFIDPQISTTFSITNPGNSAKTMYSSRVPSTDGGISSNWVNLSNKKFRLQQTLAKMLPQGTTYGLSLGKRSDLVYTEYGNNNVIESPSFEASLLGWTSINSTLTRKVSKGSLFNDLCSHGQAYCQVTATTAGATANSFGLTSNRAVVYTNRGAVASVALQAVDSTGFGTYTLTTKFYTAVGATTNTASVTKTSTLNISQTGKWYYLSNVTRQPDLYGAGTSYADITVTFVPTVATVAGTTTFLIDRTLLQQ